jgi:hypothetical protein
MTAGSPIKGDARCTAFMPSRKVGDTMTTVTELRDPALLAQALHGVGVAFTLEKDAVVMTEGPATVTLDLKTGSLTGDVEAMGKKLALVRQLYAEAKYRAECDREGIDVLHRTVGKDGDIVLCAA